MNGCMYMSGPIFLNIFSALVIFMSFLPPFPHSLDYHSFMISLKVGCLSLPTLFFFSGVVLSFPGHLHFHINQYLQKSMLGF